MNNSNNWKILESTYLTRHPMVSVRQDTCQLPGGRTIDDYYVVEEHDVALVFALTEARQLIMVEQYKHAIGKTCLELPGGYLDGDDEDPLEAARREFIEETGYQAESLIYVANFIVQPSRINNRMHIYAAKDAHLVAEQKLDENEAITVRLIDMPDVFRLIRSGQIDVTSSVAAIYLAWEHLQALE